MASDKVSQHMVLYDTNHLQGTPAMSKRQQKKLAKKQERKATWLAEKLKSKQSTLEAKQQTDAEKKAAFDLLSAEDKARILKMREERQKKKDAKRDSISARMQRVRAEGPRILIDLGFDEHMTENEIVSLTQQLSFCQAINAKAEQPFALEFSGVGGRLEKSFNLRMGNYREWPGAEINDMPYIEAYSQRTQDLVYLTADAEDPLTELDSSRIYIIGGLVDRNRHKRICSRKAVSQRISMAKLPLQDFYKLKGSAVLTVDQVFQLLLRFHGTGDWKQAISTAIPARKLLIVDKNPSQDVAQSTDTQDVSPSGLECPSENVSDTNCVEENPVIKKAKFIA